MIVFITKKEINGNVLSECSGCFRRIWDRPKDWKFCPWCVGEIYGRENESKTFVRDGKRMLHL